MTKKEIVNKVAERLNVSQGMVHEIVQQVFCEIIDCLVLEKRIELRNFGIFEVRVRARRKARNPRTNERLDVPERLAVNFKPGKEMADRIMALPIEAAAGQAMAMAADGGGNGGGAGSMVGHRRASRQ